LKQYRPHILVVLALAVVQLSGWHGALRNAFTDLRFAWQAHNATGDVVIVAIDTNSIEKIGVWPWPRRLHADLLRRLQSAGVRDIALDIDFSAPSEASLDRDFVDALADGGGSVVLASFKQPGGNAAAIHINRPLKQFADHSWSAIVNVAVEPDGLVRRYPFGEKLEGEFVPSMAAVLAGQYSERGVPFLIDFGISTTSIPRVSYIDVLRGDPATLEKLRDKKIIVGGTALELGDRFSVPNGRVISGPILQALATESILQDRALHATSDTTTLAGLCVVALVMMITWRRLGASSRVLLLAGMAGLVEMIAILLQAGMPFVLDTSLFHTAIAAYLAAVALDEIDFRDLLSRIAENRFQRVAMSLGEGLVCTDSNHRITVWNAGATSIFGYERAEMVGRPFDTICAGNGEGASRSLPIRDAACAGSLVPGGTVTEFEGRRKNGEVFAVEACFTGWQGADELQYSAVLRDISVQKREAERIRYLAEFDSLTGLANRNTLNARLDALITAAAEQPGAATLLVLGLDGFKQINDMFGHAFGDLVLRAVAERLSCETGGKGIVARVSGDEFAVAIPGNAQSEAVVQFCERIALAFDSPLTAGTQLHRVKVRIGVAVHPEGGRTADELLGNGHLALWRARAAQHGGNVMFENAIRRELEARLRLEGELAFAIERGEFELFYQPQVSLIDGDLIGAEALIRWRHPERGLVSPAEFMPVVNTSSISERIAGWVLDTACRQARAWELAGRSVRVSVNLSPSQLQSGDLADAAAKVLAVTGLTPSLLELELTEDILLLDEKRVLETFFRIRELGVRTVFDDFGTGYASLSYLKKFPLDGLKIDRSFVFDLLTDSDDAAIVGSTIGLSKQLGLSVMAEGIENRATADLLMRMGCEQGQGYCFGRPLPAPAFEAQFLATPETAAEGAAA
jgi:diguanylate cyclase (GGDEF)-like protein/PAS domain S-box-containing protein